MSKSLSGTQARPFYRQIFRFVVGHLVSELGENDMKRSAVVFAPHPDDETLGCGGTIIKKKRMGADVKIVFMTDGSSSHNLILADGLKSIRSNEALAASRLLGVEESDVVFLGFEDGKLGENLDPAVARVTEIILEQQPQEIFIPYHKDKDPSLDHRATNRIVVSALQMHRREAIIYEYPIWFWRPWAGRSVRGQDILRTLKRSAVLGSSLLRDFRCSVYIGDVLDLKRAALDQHKSQMTRLIPDSRWATLGDVADGEFLEWFFQEHEVFHRYSLPGKH